MRGLFLNTIKMLLILWLFSLALASRCTSIDSEKEIVLSDEIINDNYCDCVDGSDEPQTSACYQNQFTCMQKNAKPKIISSWMVDDLKCDCCDGMDEHHIKCPNTCKELGREQEVLEKASRFILDQGLKNRENLIKKAAFAHEKDKYDLNAKQLQLDNLVKKEIPIRDFVKIWTRKKKQSDFQQESKRSMQCPEIQELKTAKDAISVKDKEISSLREEVKGAKEELDQWLTLYQEIRSKITESIEQGIVLSKEFLEKFDVIKLEKFDVIEPKKVPEADKIEEGAVVENHLDSADSAEEDNDQTELESEDDICPATLIGLGVCVSGIVLDYLPEFLLSSLSSNLDPSVVQGKLDKHQKKLDDHLAKQSTLRKEISDIQSRINKDFGPDRVLQGLDQNCVSIDDIEYIYEVCMFGAAKQKSKKDSAEISLGNFADYKDRSGYMDPHYKTMMYKSGAVCL
jgi:protein kinase C substrate 80K-H